MTHINTEPNKTADVADALGVKAVCIPMRWKLLGGRRVFEGVVSTVRCHASAGLIKQAISERGLGRVLVVDAGDFHRVALMGDRMARLAADNGWAGVIVNGAVRDADDIGKIDIGVFASTTVPARGDFNTEGERDISVWLGDAEVRPGTYIFCDMDGLVLCHQDEVAHLNQP